MVRYVFFFSKIQFGEVTNMFFWKRQSTIKQGFKRFGGILCCKHGNKLTSKIGKIGELIFPFSPCSWSNTRVSKVCWNANLIVFSAVWGFRFFCEFKKAFFDNRFLGFGIILFLFFVLGFCFNVIWIFVLGSSGRQKGHYPAVYSFSPKARSFKCFGPFIFSSLSVFHCFSSHSSSSWFSPQFFFLCVLFSSFLVFELHYGRFCTFEMPSAHCFLRVEYPTWASEGWLSLAHCRKRSSSAFR